MHTSQFFASRNQRLSWSGSRGRLPTLRVATKRFICCAVCREWSVSVPFRADERAGSTRTGAGRASLPLAPLNTRAAAHALLLPQLPSLCRGARRAILAFLNVGRLKGACQARVGLARVRNGVLGFDIDNKKRAGSSRPTWLGVHGPYLGLFGALDP